MANKIILKRSSVAAKIPLATDLDVGELAVNLADQKLYSKTAAGVVVQVGAGLSSGKLLQVVSATYDTRTEYSGAASGTYNDTGIQASITPTNSSTKILVIFNCNGIAARLGNYHQEPDLQLTRNGVSIKEYIDVIRQGGTDFWIPGLPHTKGHSATFLDSHGSAAALTYKVQIRGNTSIAGDMRVAINSLGDGSAQGGGGSSITLMEIAP